MKEASKYRVLPIDDRVLERMNAASAGRPDLMGERTSLTLSAGVVCVDEPAESEDLLALADARLYQAKASGRDRIAA